MFAVCQRSAFPLFNDVKSEFVSTETDFHPGATLKLDGRIKSRNYSKVPIYFAQGCRLS